MDISEQASKANLVANRHDKILEHWSQKDAAEFTERDWRIFREDNDIIVKGGRVPNPIHNWKDANLSPQLMRAIQRLGFKKPKPIQMQAISIGQARKDMIAVAPTGEGKTLGYLIPLIEYLLPLPLQSPDNSELGPYSVIMVPARELAEQIAEEFGKLAQGTGLRCLAIVGGNKIEFQAIELQRGCEVLVGTPGRLRELLEKHYLSLGQCGWTVLDEADKMIDMDMEPDVKFILDSMQDQERVTHLFSATMPIAIETLAKQYLRSFCFISIGEPGAGKKDIEQHVQIIEEGAKKTALGKILSELTAPVIIFVNERRTCEILVGVVERWGWTAVDYHGGKTQDNREKSLQSFRSGDSQVMVCTNLAGRGLHIEGVTAVINFDAPKLISDYVHRIGRTGRDGHKGLAFTLLTGADEVIFYDLKEFLSRNGQEVPQALENHPASKARAGSFAESVPRRKQIVYTN